VSKPVLRREDKATEEVKGAHRPLWVVACSTHLVVLVQHVVPEQAEFCCVPFIWPLIQRDAVLLFALDELA